MYLYDKWPILNQYFNFGKDKGHRLTHKGKKVIDLLIKEKLMSAGIYQINNAVDCYL